MCILFARAHNDMHELKVQVGLSHKFFAAHQMFVHHRRDIKDASSWVKPLDQVSAADNYFRVGQKGNMKESNKTYTMRYGSPSSFNVSSGTDILAVHFCPVPSCNLSAC